MKTIQQFNSQFNNTHMKTFFKTTETATVHNYPYGSMKCTATFGLEFKPNKGFRTLFQTINPKNGRANKPKTSTYSDLIVMYRDSETQHVKYDHFAFYGVQGFNRITEFMADHFGLFTEKEIKEIYAAAITAIRCEIQAVITYCGANKTETIETLSPILKVAAEGFKTGMNVFADLHMDNDKIEALRVPDFNPFKVTEYIPQY